MKIDGSKTYSYDKLERVKMTLRKELEENHSNTEWIDRIEAMTKIELMDKYFESFSEKTSSSEICRFVNSLFHIDLEALPMEEKTLSSKEGNSSMPLAKSLLDSELVQYGKNLTGVEIRKMINHLFSVNLDAIASLEGAGISLYSKGQWIVRSDKDLFAVWTGTGDVDVRVFPTDYFTEQTGKREIPEELAIALSDLGYSREGEGGSYYFTNPTGQAVEDAFKGKTIGAILNVISHSYPDL